MSGGESIHHDYEHAVIRWIEDFPRTATPNELPARHEVGVKGVTRIVDREGYLGSHSVAWFDVWKGDAIWHSINHSDVAQVRYFLPGEPRP